MGLNRPTYLSAVSAGLSTTGGDNRYKNMSIYSETGLAPMDMHVQHVAYRQRLTSTPLAIRLTSDPGGLKRLALEKTSFMSSKKC